MEEIKEITWEDIEKANKTMITMDINGKDYALVNQRVKAFRMCYPSGSIETDYILDGEEGKRRCLFTVKVKDNFGNVLSTGTAEEKENSTFINETSFIENCETSAVGRALGFAGFGIDTSIASAEEIQNAQANQDNSNESKIAMITEGQTRIIHENGKLISKELSEMSIKKGSDIINLTLDQASELCKLINERKKNNE